MNLRRVAFGLLVGLVPTIVCAQGPGGEVKTYSLTYQGVRANAQTDKKNHTMNRNPNHPGWGGCVPSATRTAALYAGIPRAKVDAFWKLAQKRIGVNGTSPPMLAEMLEETMHGEKWISAVGKDPSVPERLSSKGYLVCGTMAYGDPALYGNRKIAHWVNYNHISKSDNLVCVEDNNDPPGVHRWMPYAEGIRRIVEGGNWVFAFRNLPAAAQVACFVLAATLLILASALALAGWTLLRPARLQ